MMVYCYATVGNNLLASPYSTLRLAPDSNAGANLLAVTDYRLNPSVRMLSDIIINLRHAGSGEQDRGRTAELEITFLFAALDAPALRMVLNDAAHARGAHVDVDHFVEVRGLEDAIFAAVFGEDCLH